MGTDTIPARSSGQTIVASFFNLLRDVLNGNHVPRNSSGVATDVAGDLGTSTLRWNDAYINEIFLGLTADSISFADDSTDLIIRRAGVEVQRLDADGWTRETIKPRAAGTAFSNVSISSTDSGSFTTTSTSFVDVTNANATITTKGGPVYISLTGGTLGVNSSSGQAHAIFGFERDTTDLTPASTVEVNATGPTANLVRVPSGSLMHIDTPSAGTYTYTLRARSVSGHTCRAESVKLVCWEL
jgi:hypothetical protein